MQESLFDDDQKTEPSVLQLDPGTLTLFPCVFGAAEAEELFTQLNDTLDWQQPTIRMHGRTLPIPRKQVWMGDPQTNYRYSGQDFIPDAWHPAVLKIKNRAESLTKNEYNSVLCNLYRDGQDSVSWHADDEPELDPFTPIASFSLGVARRFDLKPKRVLPSTRSETGSQSSKTVIDGKPQQRSNYRIYLDLPHNSLLLMSPDVQQNWVHQIAKTKKVQSARINLTFRRIKT